MGTNSATSPAPPPKMSIDGRSGLISWTPEAAEAGRSHTITVHVTDGRSVPVLVLFTIDVHAIPAVTILAPTEGEEFRGPEIEVTIDATVAGSEIRTVTVTLGAGIPASATHLPGTTRWHVSLNVSGVASGGSVISVVATSVPGVPSLPANVTVRILPAEVPPGNTTPPPDGGQLVAMLIAAGIVAAIAAVATVAVVLLRRRRGQAPAAGPAAVSSPAPPSAGVPHPASPVVASASATMSEHQGPHDLPKPPAATSAVEPFRVREAFLVYLDGRLLAHAQAAGTIETDKDLMASMLIAIQGFVRDSFQSQAGLHTFGYDADTVLVEAGQRVVLVAVVEGSVPPALREELVAMLEKLEGLYVGVLASWDGDPGTFSAVPGLIAPLLAAHQRYEIRAAKGEVRLQSGLEFLEGFVRLKVATTNGTGTVITDAELQLHYDRKTLRLDRIEPSYPAEGALVPIGNLRPGERKTVSYYLDPLICQESFIEGTLSYHDSAGRLHHATMKRRPVDIVCPLFYTPETVNPAMLKQLLLKARERDRRVFETPAAASMEQAFAMVRQVIQTHQVRLVRETVEGGGRVAWYYGLVQGTAEEIIIRVSGRDGLRALDLFVASSNLASLTGLLAELGNQLHRSIPELHASSDPALKAEVARTMALLDETGEGGPGG